MTAADQGKTFHMAVGDVLTVSLQAESGFADWQLQEPDPKILMPIVNTGATAARGVTLRSFRAIAAGTATIAATDRPVCNPGEACSQLIRAFQATVVVDA